MSELSYLRRADKTRLVDHVIHSLEEAIFKGEMPPGTRLVEHALSTQLHVSRTTVREALLLLERQGLVKSMPRGGTFVTRLSAAAAWDLCKVRALLEGYALRIGFHTYDANLFAALREITHRIRRCDFPTDVLLLVEGDIAFHELIVQRANSPHLLELWSALNGRIHALYLVSMERTAILATHIAIQHEELIEDLASGNLDQALGGLIHHYLDGWLRTPDEAMEVRRTLDSFTVDTWHGDAP